MVTHPERRCMRCFQEKVIDRYVDGVMVCSVCRHRLSEAVGFLEYHGWTLQMVLPEGSESTQVAQEPKKQKG